MRAGRVRLVWVMTHPVQYYSPWFRFIEREAREIELTVLYVTEPSPAQQGVGFGALVSWDVPLREGYQSTVLRAVRPNDRFDSESFFGLDAPGIGDRLVEMRPQAVVVNGWHSFALLRAILACKRGRIPLLYRGDTHLGGRGRGPQFLWRLRSRLVLGLFDRFLCVGKRAREYLLRCGVSSEVIYDSPHAVDNDFFAKRGENHRTPEARAGARRELGISGDDFVVLFVGKLDSNKRPLDLIRAVGQMETGARLLVVGSGSLYQPAVALANELGVRSIFRGFANQSELPRLYSLADCLVLPSERESWGLVVNEALAAGLPVVVTEGVGCAPDLVVAGETGETFPAGDVPALAARLEVLRSERSGGRSREQHCRERIRGYSFEAATEGLLAACRSLVG